MGLVEKRLAALEAQLQESRATASGASLDGNVLLWVWNWTSGGFNSCLASTEDVARKLAVEHCGDLKVSWSTFRPLLTKAERDAWEKSTRWD